MPDTPTSKRVLKTPKITLEPIIQKEMLAYSYALSKSLLYCTVNHTLTEVTHDSSREIPFAETQQLLIETVANMPLNQMARLVNSPIPIVKRITTLRLERGWE